MNFERIEHLRFFFNSTFISTQEGPHKFKWVGTLTSPYLTFGYNK